MTDTATRADHILIIEDEENIASFARMYLEAEGFRVSVADRGDVGLAVARSEHPTLVVVDLMLPGVDGFEITRQLRTSSRIPIIVLTARDDPIDKVVGLEMGADDYITKPFNPRELIARIRAVLRRSDPSLQHGSGPGDTVLELGAMRIALGGREVEINDDAVALTPKEFDLLVLLVENRGIVMTREQLLERVWGYTFLGDSRTIDVHIRQLRRKLGDACQIETVWGTGYKVVAPR
jgi:DNA-binding response OmpR family regulator